MCLAVAQRITVAQPINEATSSSRAHDSCFDTHILFSTQLFRFQKPLLCFGLQMADPGKGVVQISYRQVTCPSMLQASLSSRQNPRCNGCLLFASCLDWIVDAQGSEVKTPLAEQSAVRTVLVLWLVTCPFLALLPFLHILLQYAVL